MGGGGESGIQWAQPSGPRYAYPKWVWSPTGAWWCDPKYWRQNTLGITLCVGVPVIALSCYYSAKHEEHHRPPRKWSFSMLYAQQYQPGGRWYEEAQKFPPPWRS